MSSTLAGSHPITSTRGRVEHDELSGELSEPVRASLDEAVRMVESVLDELINEGKERS